MFKKGLIALATLVAALAMAATTELVVTAEVVRQPDGYALKIGEQMVPLRAYEMPACLATARGPVKLELKLEGDPPKLVAVAVAEGPCPEGTELPAPAQERLALMLQNGLLNAKGEVVREQNRWMLRIGDAEVPLDPTAVPPCLLEDGAEVEVGTVEGDEGELTVAKEGCTAQIQVQAHLRERIRETLRTQTQAERSDEAMTPAKVAEETHEAVKNTAEEVKDTVEEKVNEVKDKVEETVPTPPVPKVPGDATR